MKASVGCVIRNSYGAWARGYGGMIGLADPTVVELGRGRETLHHIKNDDPCNGMPGLVSMIRNLLSKNWEDLHVYHISPSANAVASALTNHCLTAEDGGLNSMVDPPSAIRDVIEAEM
ncbi:hypothetical protein ACET3Z_010737 [Daucus carota]